MAKPIDAELFITKNECYYREIEIGNGNPKTYFYGLRQDGYSINFDQNILRIIQDLNAKLYLQKSEIENYEWKIEE